MSPKTFCLFSQINPKSQFKFIFPRLLFTVFVVSYFLPRRVGPGEFLAMYLCDSKWNFTLGMYVSLHMEELISIDADGKRMRGLYGDYLFKPLANRKGRPFKCRLIGEYYLGSKQKNSSFSGAVGLLISEKIDAYMKVLNPLLTGECDQIQPSPPLNNEE